MANKVKRPEQTSETVGTKASALLSNGALLAAEARLGDLAADPATNDLVRADLFVVLGALQSARSVAASALTQRPDKG